jgi:hypothetical protein
MEADDPELANQLTNLKDQRTKTSAEERFGASVVLRTF